MNEKIGIVIADDHPLFREGVANSLANQADIVVLGQASDGVEACALVEELIPDLVLLDITMPKMNGIEAVRHLSANMPLVKTMMLTVSEVQDDLLNALKAGAKGYVLKGVSAAELVESVRRVCRGEVFISPSLASGILFEMTNIAPTYYDLINNLTERETGILKLVAKGLTNKEIGEELGLAEKTIKHYMSSVLQKLQVRSRVEAALLAQKHRLQ